MADGRRAHALPPTSSAWPQPAEFTSWRRPPPESEPHSADRIQPCGGTAAPIAFAGLTSYRFESSSGGRTPQRLVTPPDEQLSGKITAQHRVLRLSRCLSVDLEVSQKTGRIHALAGIRPDTDESVVFPGSRRSLGQALADLDDLGEGADFLLGHNLIDFDHPHLQAANSNLRLLHHAEGGHTLAQSPRLSSQPVSPSGEALPGCTTQARAPERSGAGRAARPTGILQPSRRELLKADTALLAAWHWLTGGWDGPGFDLFFEALRGRPRPSDAEGREGDSGACRRGGPVVQAPGLS